jgi:AcrR family transcriptional regulator
MGRPLRVTDEQIIEAARTCFAEYGFGVSVNVIADHVKVTSPLIFKRFHNKANLMKIAMLGARPANDFPWQVIAKPLSKSSAREQIEALMIGLMEHFASAAPMLGALLKSGLNPPEVHNALMEIGESGRAFQETCRWLADAQERGVLGHCDSETLTSIIFGSMLFAATGGKSDTSALPTPAQHVNQLLAIIWPGIAGQKSTTKH